MDKLSLTDIKKKNFSDVYRFIYKNSQTSKQAIAQGLQMSLPTVSQHLNTLLDMGLIQRSGQLESAIGRKAAAYSILPEARTAIGVEILKNKITLTAVNLYGQLTAYQRIFVDFENSQPYYNKISSHIKDFIKEQSFIKTQLLGAGFAVQGLVTSDHTKITYGKILDMEGFTSDIFENQLQIPCCLRHDSECAASTTLWSSPQVQDAIYLSLGSHLGCAVIIHGKIQQGRTGKSGKMEHMTLYPGGKKCYCGQRGCAECYCCADALLDEGEDLELFFEKKKRGDSRCLTRWHDFLNHLSLFLNNIHLVIDSWIILGGHLAPYMEDSDFTYLHQKIMNHTAFPEQEPFILPGSRLPHEVAIGAALGYVSEFLEQI